MAKNKKSFVLYADLIHTVRKMPEDKAGKLLLTILEYVNDENPKVDDMVVDLVFEPIKQQLKRDLIKFETTKAERSKSGQLGNLKKYHIDLYKRVISEDLELEGALVIAKGRKGSHSDTKLAVNDNVSVNVINNNIIDRKSQFKKLLSPHVDKYSVEMLKDFYEYWTEHGERDKKMRFEKEKSFGLSRRLATWKKNNDKFNPTSKSSKREQYDNYKPPMY